MQTLRFLCRALLLALLAATAGADSSSNGAYGGYVGSDQWLKAQRDAARGQAAIAGMAVGPQGGCTSVPAGWSRVAVTVYFPVSYGGYSQWVNSATLVPAGGGVATYVAGHEVAESYSRPALRAGVQAVHSDMCAPGGRRYWLVVDSGMQRVAIGEIALPRRGHLVQSLMAPPLGSQIGTGATHGPAKAATTQPASGADWKPPQSDHQWKPPQIDHSWKPPH